MSDYVYTFNLGIGFSTAEKSETFDLVEDLGYDPDDLEDPEDLEDILREEVEEWQWQHIETWTEKQ